METNEPLGNAKSSGAADASPCDWVLADRRSLALRVAAEVSRGTGAPHLSVLDAAKAYEAYLNAPFDDAK